MSLFVDRRLKRLFIAVIAVILSGALLAFAVVAVFDAPASWALAGCTVFELVGVVVLLIAYFRSQNRIIENAIANIKAYLAGDRTARIACDEEGNLNRLFHEINGLAAILNAHAENEGRAQRFMKDTLSDISHQLKTPLATLNIYNGIMQDAASDMATLREFSALSEQELDRLDVLVKNLLTITKLDAGTLLFEKQQENVAALMARLEKHFSWQAEQEGKTLCFAGETDITLYGDRTWLLEAWTNLIKNAFDHTSAGCTIRVSWQRFAQVVQVVVADDGCGIHPEDLPHIFKRFYRSRFSKDTQGVGLGLPLAKAIVEAHSGTIEVDSVLGRGTTFTMNFLIAANPTKL